MKNKEDQTTFFDPDTMRWSIGDDGRIWMTEYNEELGCWLKLNHIGDAKFSRLPTTIRDEFDPTTKNLNDFQHLKHRLDVKERNKE